MKTKKKKPKWYWISTPGRAKKGVWFTAFEFKHAWSETDDIEKERTLDVVELMNTNVGGIK